MDRKSITAVFCFFIFCCSAYPQKVIQLYSGTAPGSEGWNWTEKQNDSNQFRTKVVYNVSKPTLTAFLPNASAANGAAVIVCPGGGFYILSIESEGNEVARRLNEKGIAAFVLRYRLVHSLTDDPVQELMSKMGTPEFDKQTRAVIPLSISDGKAAVAYVFNHAAEYNLAKDKIGIMGFSAGGTVAAAVAYDDSSTNRPAFVAPIYAFIPPGWNKPVQPNSPAMFIVAASDDQLGLAPHSVNLYNKWMDAKRPAELHMYSKGGHGFGMRKQNLPSDRWIDLFFDWLAVQGFTPAGK